MDDTGGQPQLPPYWLVYALPWPSGADGWWHLARAAYALGPAFGGPQPRAARDVLYVADTYFQTHGGQVVFFSDLADFLEDEGTSWQERRTDPLLGLDQLRYGDNAPPGLPLALGRRAHAVVANPARAPATGAVGAAVAPDHPIQAWERAAIRQAIAIQLTVDWVAFPWAVPPSMPEPPRRNPGPNDLSSRDPLFPRL